MLALKRPSTPALVNGRLLPDFSAVPDSIRLGRNPPVDPLTRCRRTAEHCPGDRDWIGASSDIIRETARLVSPSRSVVVDIRLVSPDNRVPVTHTHICFVVEILHELRHDEIVRCTRRNAEAVIVKDRSPLEIES